MNTIPPFMQRMSIPLMRSYFSLRSTWPVWFLLNHKPRALYQGAYPRLDDVQQRLVRELKETGIAATHLDELFPGKNFLSQLTAYTNELMEHNIKKSNKEFTAYVLDPVPEVDVSNPFVEFALRARIIDIVNAYHDMYTRFFYLQLNINHPVSSGSLPQHSQRWHRDLDDLRMCKIFVYLNDVDQGGGPFMFLPRSHYGEKWRSVFPQTLPFGLYPSDAQVASVVPASEFRTCTGRAGTVIFCDVSGLHRGGYVTKTQRLMLTIGYRSNASVWPTCVKHKESAMLTAEVARRGPAFHYAVAPFDRRFPSKRLFKLFKRFAIMHAREKENIGMSMGH